MHRLLLLRRNGEPELKTAAIVASLLFGLSGCSSEVESDEAESMTCDPAPPLAACLWKYNLIDPGYAECRPVFPDKRTLVSASLLVDPPDDDPLPEKLPVLALIAYPTFQDPAGGMALDIDGDEVTTPSAWREAHWIELTVKTVIEQQAFDYLFVFEPYDGVNVGPILDTKFAFE
jgi:hypothetical protein